MMIAYWFGALFGLLAVVLGAFGAHALKDKFTPEQQQSFEVGVRYQMYHAIVLLFVGLHGGLTSTVVWFFAAGIFLFSFSIYGLCLSGAFGKKWRFLGPVTPLGGLLLVSGWLILLQGLLT